MIRHRQNKASTPKESKSKSPGSHTEDGGQSERETSGRWPERGAHGQNQVARDDSEVLFRPDVGLGTQKLRLRWIWVQMCWMVFGPTRGFCHRRAAKIGPGSGVAVVIGQIKLPCSQIIR